MSAARRMIREQARKERAQPPTAGAVDLAGLKGGVSDEQREEGRRQLLAQNGLLCSCGKRVDDEGVILFSYGEGLIPTPQGPQPGIQFGTSTFCSRECPVLVGQLSIRPRHGEPRPIAIRSLPATEWLVSPDELGHAYDSQDGEQADAENGQEVQEPASALEPAPEQV